MIYTLYLKISTEWYIRYILRMIFIHYIFSSTLLQHNDWGDSDFVDKKNIFSVFGYQLIEAILLRDCHQVMSQYQPLFTQHWIRASLL